VPSPLRRLLAVVAVAWLGRWLFSEIAAFVVARRPADPVYRR
jgi:hypothetical protein